MKLFNKKRGSLPLFLFVVLLIIFVCSFLYLAPRLVRKADDYVTVEMIASGGDWWQFLPQAPNWLADSIAVGDTEMAGSRKVVEILDLKKYPEEANSIIWLKARLLVRKDPQTGTLRFRQLPLTVGSLVVLQPHLARFPGHVISIEGVHTPSPFKTLVVTVKLLDQFNWFADAVSVGDFLTDGAGTKIAEIESKTVVPTETAATTADGRMVQVRHPLHRDITLQMKLQVVNRDSFFYFDQVQPVKIGTRLWIPLQRVNLTGAYVADFHEE